MAPLNPETLLCVALFDAKNTLGLTDDEFGAILHLDHASIRVLLERGTLNFPSREGDIATDVIRIEQALRTMVGNDRGTAQYWVHCHNHHIKGIPVHLMQNAEGLSRVLAYLQMVGCSS